MHFNFRHSLRKRGVGVWGASLILILILSWYLLFLEFGDAQGLGYVNAFGFWFAIIALVAAIIAAACGNLVIAGGGLCLMLTVLSWGLQIPTRRPVPEGAHAFRIVTASLRNYNKDMLGAARAISANGPQIVVVQEADIVKFVGALRFVTGVRWSFATRSNELIACRCVMSSIRHDNYILSADLTVGSNQVRVWNVRAPKSYADVTRNRLYFYALADQMRRAPRGIAAGDFNATPWNEGYRIIGQVARDSWLGTGWGPGFTFPTRARRLGVLGPLIRIDHVFATGDLVTIEAKTGTASPGADHLPVIVDFTLPHS
ncbi:endonuclease/exonuclease/phosphatase family protein [Sphingomonas sp. ASY06-1R]|uniref:endonuclease/exonuclease/phosphatase family protein n=1 Tax=Sphingomonas sp. ASY06-1R TaxID=3445771 RepID=UPI003FA3042B